MANDNERAIIRLHDFYEARRGERIGKRAITLEYIADGVCVTRQSVNNWLRWAREERAGVAVSRRRGIVPNSGATVASINAFIDAHPRALFARKKQPPQNKESSCP